MVSEITIETKLNIPYALLWRVRSEPYFMSFLVRNGALNRMDATPEETVTAGIKTRKQVYVPKTIEIPAMVKPVFDDTYLEITDTHEWDENRPFESKFSITPGVMQEYITMSGILKLKPCSEAGDLGCIQVIEGTCQVDIPFVGWYVEQAIIANMHTFYEAYPAHIKTFADTLAITYGDGSIHSLHAAYDRLEKEKEAEIKFASPTTPSQNGLPPKTGHDAAPNGVTPKLNSDCSIPAPDPSAVGDTTQKPNLPEAAK